MVTAIWRRARHHFNREWVTGFGRGLHAGCRIVAPGCLLASVAWLDYRTIVPHLILTLLAWTTPTP